MKHCEACGDEFTPQRPWGKFCSTRCKSRYARGARAPVRAVDSPPPSAGPVERATAAELAAAGRLGTVHGQLAVVLAGRLDDSDRDTGAGVAAVAKALRGVLDSALADREQGEDPLDELRAKRDSKRAQVVTR